MWFSLGSEDVGREMREMKELLMVVNADLQQVKTNLTEASGEIVAKLDDLSNQVANGTADPALVEEIKTLAQGLADVVPNPETPAGPPAEPEAPAAGGRRRG